MDELLKSHYEATLKRISEEKIVLVVQDTTSLNYSAHPLTKGLGPISPKSEGVIGLLLHDSMAFNLAGTPLGLSMCSVGREILNSLAKGSFVMSGPSSKKRVRSG